MFAIVSCASEPIEPSPRDITILFGLHGTFLVEPTFLRIVQGNILETTVFTEGTSFGLPPDSVKFDTSVLDDFVGIHGSNVLRSVETGEHWVIERSERELLQRHLNKIWRLAEDVVNNGTPAPVVFYDGAVDVWETIGGGGVRVWVIIDGNMYWSLFTDSYYRIRPSELQEPALYNISLLHLLYHFIDLSPIPMGFQRDRGGFYSWG